MEARTAPVAGLYYPWIHFRDDDWVKVAMLYWRRLQRIVPGDYAKHDSETVRTFVEHELIGDQDAGDSRDRVATTFSRVIRNRQHELRSAFGIDQADLWAAQAPVRHFILPDVRDSDRFAYIHVDKIAYDLRQTLVETGLGAKNRGGDWSWMGVHPKIAGVYMTALAQDIAARGRYQPVTEAPTDHVAVGGWSVDRLTDALLPAGDGPVDTALDEPISTLAFIALRSVVPDNLSQIPASRILDVRKRYGEELRDFQRGIRELATDAGLAEVEDPTAFQLHLNDLYEDRLRPRLDRLEKDLALFGLDTVPAWLSLKTTLPPAAAGLAEGLDLNNPAITTGAVALGAVGLRQSAAAEAQGEMEGNPAAYMLRVKESLAPRALRSQIRRAIRRFATGI